jgi:predicted Zn-dependent protease
MFDRRCRNDHRRTDRTAQTVTQHTSPDDRELHEELHREIIEEFAMETEAWATERVDRVMARLNAVRRNREPLAAHVLWVRECTAFTTPAPHVYISRRLLEHLPSDETAAFVLAHEAAHHDCGHLDLFQNWLDVLPRGTVSTIAAGLFRHLEHRMYGPEREAEADLRALSMCLDAGYNGERCLQVFDILENESLNRGDISGVFGPESWFDDTAPEANGVSDRLQRWIWTRARRYLPLRERRDRAWAYYRQLQAAHDAR